jgi:hypothetical protein
VNGAGASGQRYSGRRGLGWSRGCRWLKIETQNVNVSAWRLYQKTGRTLGAIDRFAYPEQPAEVQLLWWKALASPENAIQLT